MFKGIKCCSTIQLLMVKNLWSRITRNCVGYGPLKFYTNDVLQSLTFNCISNSANAKISLVSKYLYFKVWSYPASLFLDFIRICNNFLRRIQQFSTNHMCLPLITFITPLQAPCGPAWRLNHFQGHQSPAETLLTSHVPLKYTMHHNGSKLSAYPVLVNLKSYLSQLLQFSMCLLVVDNFQTISLILPEIPVILRNKVLPN